MVTMLLGRAAACIRTETRDPESLNSAIATHAHCAQRASGRDVDGGHNDVNGTSVPMRMCAVALQVNAQDLKTHHSPR